MKHREEPSPYRLTHEEGNAYGVVDLRDLKEGDVFLREGTPCMILCAPRGIGEVQMDYKVFICNLTNGSAWWASPADQVWPATEAHLTFKTGRRG